MASPTPPPTAAGKADGGAAPVTGVPVTSALYVELQPLTYTGPVPTPHPPCTEPTPDEQQRRAEAEAEQRRAQKEAEAQQQQQQQQQQGGGATALLSSLRTMASQVAQNVEKGVSDLTRMTYTQVRQTGHSLNSDRFRSSFAELTSLDEPLLAAYDCKAMHAGEAVAGTLFITPHYLCFYAQTVSTLTSATHALREAVDMPTAQARVHGIKHVLPFQQIASVRLSLALPTLQHNAPPFFMMVPSAQVMPTALQVYSPDGNRLFQFFAFDSLRNKAGELLNNDAEGSSLLRAYNYLDHAWRSCVHVPVEGVQYAQ